MQTSPPFLPDRFAQAAEANLMEKNLSFAALSGGEQHGPNPRWFLTGVNLPGYNGVVQAVFPHTLAGAAIKDTLSTFHQRHVPLTWWVGPSTQPANLGIRLQGYGFQHSRDLVGMCAEIEAIRLPEGRQAVQVELELLDGPDQLAEWLPVYMQGFSNRPSLVQNSMDLLAEISFRPNSPWRHYLARRGKQVIAISSLFLGSTSAGLYNLVTVPAERGRGIGSAMTLATFAEARRLGYALATLQTAHPDAMRLYHRLGFDVYCKVGVYQKVRY